MQKYIVLLKEKQKGTLNDDLLKRHIDYLRELNSLGQLHLCGPFQDDDGAIQIIKSNSKSDVEKIIANDPFIKEKYYQSHEIFRLIEANENNNWLSEEAQTKNNLE